MKNFLKSFIYAAHGIWLGIVHHRNLKVQIAISIIVIGAGFYFHIPASEWYVVLLCIALVICLEMINSAIEGLVDLVTMEKKILAGKIKDIAAGAVLMASLIAVIIGVVLFWKYLME